jgi:hypothetical protein
MALNAYMTSEELSKLPLEQRNQIYVLREKIAQENYNKLVTVLSGVRNIDGLKVSFSNIPSDSKMFNKNTNDGSPVILINSRITISANINGVNIPFYVSTGSGGKKNVPVGKWYPYFGHIDGYFVKTDENQINKSYYNSALKSVKNWLDENVSFLQPFDDGANSLPRFLNTNYVNDKSALAFLSRGFKSQDVAEFNTETARERKDDALDRLNKATGHFSPTRNQIKSLIFSQEIDDLDIYLWREGKCRIKNPSAELMDYISRYFKNYKLSQPYVFVDYRFAKDYFKDYIKNRTLRSDVFEYILDNNFLDYLKLYMDWGKPDQLQNLEIYKKLNEEESKESPDRSKFTKSSKAIRKIRF